MLFPLQRQRKDLECIKSVSGSVGENNVLQVLTKRCVEIFDIRHVNANFSTPRLIKWKEKRGENFAERPKLNVARWGRTVTERQGPPMDCPIEFGPCAYERKTDKISRKRKHLKGITLEYAKINRWILWENR